MKSPAVHTNKKTVTLDGKKSIEVSKETLDEVEKFIESLTAQQEQMRTKVVIDNKTTYDASAQQNRSVNIPTPPLNNEPKKPIKYRVIDGKTVKKTYSLSEELAEAITQAAKNEGISASRLIEDTMREIPLLLRLLQHD